ncbi:hypothetical protein [Azohydromonas aeria]|uniref:hypothetical protein n=1 Tax=Azohydromonas aeria TaxID=2590212 RepID=UPI0012FA49D4|nr:hypothetical protein [Azohydromonas aeria]
MSTKPLTPAQRLALLDKMTRHDNIATTALMQSARNPGTKTAMALRERYERHIEQSNECLNKLRSELQAEMTSEKPTAKTGKERWAALDQRRRDLGLKPIGNLYAHPDDHDKVKDHVDKLNAKRYGPGVVPAKRAKKADTAPTKPDKPKTVKG